MKNSLHSLRRQLRWTQAALALTVAALLCAATPAVRPLFLAAGTNQPTTPVSLAGANWTGTLDAGRLPGTGSFNNVITPNMISPNGPLQVGGSGNGTLSLVGGVYYGGGISLHTIDALPLASFDAQTGSLTLNRGGGGNLTIQGTFTAGGPALIGGAISFDGGSGYSDGLGTLTVAGLRSADESLVLDDDGLAINRQTIADGAGQLWIGGNYLIGDSDGYLNTGSQFYTVGTVIPTGFLVLKDGNGVRFRIPAAVAP